jgi:AcrR family transcriptional regulator
MPRTAPAGSEASPAHEPSRARAGTEPGPGPGPRAPAGQDADARTGAGGGLPADEAGPASTRDRILDAALDLFVQHGFDGTSVRQIAERVGTTKAALYYYFASKDEILMALHMRLHEFGRELIKTTGDEPMTLEAWGALITRLIDEITAQRMLFLLHERNQAAFEKLHGSKEHDSAHEDIQGRFRAVLADPRVPLADRVRMAGAFGVLFAGIFLYGDVFSSATTEELRDILAGIVQDVLRTS